jgi:hypothetical protein
MIDDSESRVEIGDWIVTEFGVHEHLTAEEFEAEYEPANSEILAQMIGAR